MSQLTTVALAIGLGLFGSNHPSNAPPSRDDIGQVEEKIRLPDDAPASLQHYERYYAWTVDDDGKRVIYGELVFVDLLGAARPPGGLGRTHAINEKDMPAIANGGCGVIVLYFDLRSGRRPALYCNAVAPSSSP
jgi:hypothetical protein